MSPDFFRNNRENLTASLQGGLVILSAYAAMQRSNDMSHQFEQEANFWWCCGIEEPDWVIIIDGKSHKSWLVMPKISENHEIFDGSLSARTAKEISGVDYVISSDESLRVLRDLAKRHSVVYTSPEPSHSEYLDFILNPAPKKVHELLSRYFKSVQNCRKDIAVLRAIKQPEEIAMIKQAINLTVRAFSEIKENLATYSYEYQIEADFSHYFRIRGAVGHAYEPIVASGANACTLHYIKNDSKLTKRQLILIDIGAKVGGYAADITRTYAREPITKRQRDVHAAVNHAHKEIIALIKPDLPVEEYQKSVDHIMKAALLSLGLMKDSSDEASYRKYFPHSVSHGLGIDVHDSLGAPRYFKTGMVMTVEPGIYIPEEGIGVRIEDDILVTDKGRLNLSARLSTDL
jgi:Xaa-Pro aminopeptidase